MDICSPAVFCTVVVMEWCSKSHTMMCWPKHRSFIISHQKLNISFSSLNLCPKTKKHFVCMNKETNSVLLSVQSSKLQLVFYLAPHFCLLHLRWIFVVGLVWFVGCCFFVVVVSFLQSDCFPVVASKSYI